MRKIVQLILSFPHGASVKDCESIVMFAQTKVSAGVSEGGMQTTNKYGLNVDDVTFSEDCMHYVFGHARKEVIEKCGNCGSVDFHIVRDMTSRRTCSKCSHTWECPK